jgi:hypothetical protein
MTKSDKEIGQEFIEKAFKLYPEWNKYKNLPKGKFPEALKEVDLSKKQMSLLPLDENTKSVLCGTIISDTSFSISKGYKNARFQARHSTRQFTWFTWKYLVILKEFTRKSGVVFSKPDGFQLKSELLPGETLLGKLKIASIAHEKLTELHKIICVNNRKKVQRFWLNHMNNYFLMTIWLDDGSLMSGRQGVISFNSMPVEEQRIFREYLLKVWGIKTSFQDTGLKMANGQENLRITIDDYESLLTLLRLIAPIIPVREMLYKVCFVPKGNPNLLERWRTELAGLVKPEFRADIEKYYADIENSDLI